LKCALAGLAAFPPQQIPEKFHHQDNNPHCHCSQEIFNPVKVLKRDKGKLSAEIPVKIVRYHKVKQGGDKGGNKWIAVGIPLFAHSPSPYVFIKRPRLSRRPFIDPSSGGLEPDPSRSMPPALEGLNGKAIKVFLDSHKAKAEVKMVDCVIITVSCRGVNY
jgi:hypothetical protein